MRSKASGLTSAVALVAGLLSSPLPALAQPPPQATVGAQTEIFAAPLGLYDPEENAASMLFLSTPLSAAQEASARRDGSWPLDGVGPALKVTLTFLPGKFSGAVEDLDRCWIGIDGFKVDSIEISGTAADCHLVSIGGRLQPGGMLVGLFEGKGKGYAFRLPFAPMFPRGATTESNGAPVAPTAAGIAAPAPVVAGSTAMTLNTAAGTGTFTGQTLRVTHGLAWVSGEKFEVALFDHVPSAGMLAELKTGSWGDGGPIATLTFMLDAGKSGPAAVSYCYVNFSFRKGGPMGVNFNDAARCGLTDIGGTLEAGGSIMARLAGSAPMRDKVPMAWDLRFNLPLSK